MNIERTHSGNSYSFVGAKLPVPASRMGKIIEAPDSEEYGFSPYHFVALRSADDLIVVPRSILGVVIFHSSQSGLISFRHVMSTMVYSVSSRQGAWAGRTTLPWIAKVWFPVRVSILTSL